MPKSLTLVVVTVLCFVQCNTRFESSIPYARVSVHYTDIQGKLLTTFGNIVVQPSPTTFVGYAGVAAFRNTDGLVTAYELACPYELRTNVAIRLTQGSPIAECPQCHSHYDLSIGGYPIDGTSKEKLKTYNCSYSDREQILRIWN